MLSERQFRNQLQTLDAERKIVRCIVAPLTVEETMRIASVAALLVCFAASPAFAADYYIVQDTTTKKCTVTTTKPTTSTMVVVGDGKVYTSQTEAESAVKTVKVCETK